MFHTARGGGVPAFRPIIKVRRSNSKAEQRASSRGFCRWWYSCAPTAFVQYLVLHVMDLVSPFEIIWASYYSSFYRRYTWQWLGHPLPNTQHLHPPPPVHSSGLFSLGCSWLEVGCTVLTQASEAYLIAFGTCAFVDGGKALGILGGEWLFRRFPTSELLILLWTLCLVLLILLVSGLVRVVRNSGDVKGRWFDSLYIAQMLESISTLDLIAPPQQD